MITRIALRDFKCFPRADLRLTHLNVFAGSNGTGKSTIVQALLVLYQSARSGALLRSQLQLNGPLVDLGTGREVLYKRSDLDRFEILIEEKHAGQRFSALVPSSESLHTLQYEGTSSGATTLSFLDGPLLYLSADRLGPQAAYPMNLDDSLGNPMGRRGEFAPLLFERHRNKHVVNTTILLEDPDGRVFPEIEAQFTLWMKRLFPGFQARTDAIDQMDVVRLGLSLQKQIGQPEFLRPTNVGFGVSVVFPIVLAGLLAEPTSTLIVENPEAHLHPTAQSLVGEFLARVAVGGPQVFVETHSDHVVNGIRLAFRNGIIGSAELQFCAFTKTDEYGSNRVEAITLTPSGEFSSQPSSFFDQIDNDLRLLYGV